MMLISTIRMYLSLCVVVALTFALTSNSVSAQDNVVLLTADMIEVDVIFLGQIDGWVFKAGNLPGAANPDFDTSDWINLKPSALNNSNLNESGVIDGWFRIRIQVDSTLSDIPLFWRIGTWGAIDLYIDGELVKQYGIASSDRDTFEGYNPLNQLAKYANIEPGKEYVIAIYLTDHLTSILNSTTQGGRLSYDPLIRLSIEEYNERISRAIDVGSFWSGAMVFSLTLLCLIFWILYVQNRSQDALKLIAFTTSVLTVGVWFNTTTLQHSVDVLYYSLFNFLFQYSVMLYAILVTYSMLHLIADWRPLKIWHLIVLTSILAILSWITGSIVFPIAVFATAGIIIVYVIIRGRANLKGANVHLARGAIISSGIALLFLTAEAIIQWTLNVHVSYLMLSAFFLTIPVSMLMYINRRYKDSLVEVEEHSNHVVKLSEEKELLLKEQNVILEHQVSERTIELQKSLDELKVAQEQLIQSEKMASLGQLTAGIAHEIKNPLNFVNNFSDLTRELVIEVREEMEAAGLSDDQRNRIEPILVDIEQNVQKINEHGRRADSIVKGMLQHSRGKSGERESVMLNTLIAEYVNLAYHGMRAQDPSFNVTLKMDFDPDIGKCTVVPQDFSRAILNLVNNACYAADQKKRSLIDKGFNPTVSISTRKLDDQVEIVIQDNGTGIPDHIRKKIFEPFFTTKPTGSGTGLGLSLTYDIIVSQHSGQLEVNSTAGEFTEFRILLPIT